MSAGIRFVVGAMVAVLLSALFAMDVHAQTPATRVVLLAADSTASVADVTAKLVSQSLDVTVIDVGVGTTAPTPTRDELLAYQAVLTWSHSTRGYADPTELGNALAAYVDAGGGVVQAVYSLSRDIPFRLDGRWRTGAYEPFTLPTTSAVSTGFYLNMTQVLPTHPIMSGVSSFSGGGSSFHYQVQTQGCAETIANWSNGRVLVDARVGPRGGRIIGLNMYPVSDSINLANWDHMTGGARMMANALRFAASPAPAPPAGAPVVALVGSTPAPWLEDVRCKVQESRLFSQVDAINVSSTTPSLATLGQYDAVLTWSDLPYQDSTALGNVLADYADAHHGVVEAATSFVPGFDLGGRWGSGGYRPFTEGPLAPRASLSLVPVISGHELLHGVSSVRGGSSSYHSAPVTLGSASTLVANWTDGQPLVVVGSGPTGSRIVGLNFFPPSGAVRGDLWDPRSDGGRLMANALLDASNRYPSANAGPDQTLEATSPSGVSFTIHGTGSDQDGDPITFEWSGAATATGASIILDAPPPAAPSTSQTYTMTLTVSDGKGGITTDSVDLTVTDSTAPVLSGVPTGSIDLVATGAAGALLTFGPVTASDAVDGDRPVVCTPASSSMLPVGANVVTCMASDSRGNTSSASFNVTVTDTTAPVLSGVPVGPINLVATEPGGALLTFGPVTAFDLVDGDRPVICTPASSSMIPVGTTVVTCTASDPHGNTSSASFNVTVTDTTAPVLSGVPAGPINLVATGPGGALLTFGPVTASDAVDGDRPVICTPASSSLIPVGTTVVTCAASDSHANTTSASFNVIVTDTAAPVLSGVPVGPINLVATGPGGALLTFGPVTASDAVDGVRPVTCTPASSSMIPVGTTVVTCAASDSHGNTSSANFNATVTAPPAPPVPPVDPVTPGWVFGDGFIRNDDMRYEFKFMAVEGASGLNRGGLVFNARSDYSTERRHIRRRDDEFLSKTTESVVFDGRSGVVFKGTGRWNGRDGYSYEVSALENSRQLHRGDIVRITIKSSDGTIVGEVNGRLGGGNVQFFRRP